MTKTNRSLLCLTALAGCISVSSGATAQMDISRPAPNVLLLVDSSGSMEYKASTSDFPECNNTVDNTSEKSRWIDLVEVLTGSIRNYRCDKVDRSSSAFRDEYHFFTAIPYDYGYLNPYHRPMSGKCIVAPGTVDSTNAFEFKSDAIKFHERGFNDVACDFNQSQDGLLDSFQTLVRFGLMTFDTLIDPGDGYQGSAVQAVDGMNGAWSYFVNGQSARGRPVGCRTLVDYEVGARNAAAPPWEGRMVAFGDPAADQADRTIRNEQIQKILLATRPYLATPIAGLLEDAKDFLWEDDSNDPLDASKKFGPNSDPYITGGCRDTHIILLTDGEPNLDLRPHCELKDPGPDHYDGECPYPDRPEEIAWKLATAPPNKRVITHVIGFAMSDLSAAEGGGDCTDLTDSDLNDPGGRCDASTGKQLSACCTLNRIAFNGGSGRARFANDVTELRRHLMSVLFDLVEGTSRTRAVYVPSGPPDPNGIAYRFFSAFNPHPQGWRAKLERQRWTCSTDDAGVLAAIGKDIDPSAGDDFALNVNSSGGLPRTFYSVEGDVSSGVVYSERSIRPNLARDDGAGTYSGSVRKGEGPAFSSEVEPRALGTMPTAECVNAGITTARECATMYTAWWLGLDNSSPERRCPTPGTDCARIGAIYHSTPVAVNRPSELIRDETYDAYASSDEVAHRPLMLYTSTTDGFLHAFKVTTNRPGTDTFKVNEQANNEMWAFAPPSVLPGVPTLFANPASRLLDSAPVVREVVATETDSSSYGYHLTRTATEARELSNTWRTILVQGFGERSGYFALDITDPEAGPQFLWQLTTDASGARLFGDRTGTPLITTVFVKIGLSDPVEMAVAVLPGGGAKAPGGQATRQSSLTTGIDPSFPLRSKIRAYPSGGSDERARSLTIVRLDSGEIIRTFRRNASEVSTLLQAADVVTVAPLDSPISGEPAAFPPMTGAIADRLFVGDSDGTVWRVDLSATDPDSWTMKPFFDLHTKDVTAADSQPIISAPVLSTKSDGTVTLLVASGDQETFTPSGTSYVWSLSDRVNDDYTGFESKANWYLKFTDGERVAGPPSVFSKVAYFATYQPASLSGADVCTNGRSRVWGVDYVLPKSDANLALGGTGRILADASNPPAAGEEWPQYLDSTSSDDIPTDAGIFGVSVALVPSCTQTAVTNDSASGSGRHVSITSVTPPRYQLLMQTGSAGQSRAGGNINFTTLDLSPPDNAAVVESWAAILE